MIMFLLFNVNCTSLGLKTAAVTAGSRNQRAAARRRLPVSMLENFLFTRTNPTLKFSFKLQQAPTAKHN